ncbi:hypothetical protein GHT06_021199 [Daphnia sinensis]|uniref:Spaetzle domain-containing protein n=1 Tax=Daphnia sinensis TaxID=1820382 RepID=A0AAD5KZZ0_9CRUS|nr:hypothetical protein GHT06_021199 [Daphnia sinensis]
MKLSMLLSAMLIAGVFSQSPKTSSRPSLHQRKSSFLQRSKPRQNPNSPLPQSKRVEYVYCDPRSPPTCVKNLNETFCLKDVDYPEKDIKYYIEFDPLVVKKHADVGVQSADNLVDGVTSLEEKHFDYSLYNGSPFSRGNWVGGDGYVCPSDVLYVRPKRALNVEGEWRVIVQDNYTQTQRFETCLFPGASCRTIAPCYRTKCVQKYVYQRMLSYDPCDVTKGLFIDIYKFPSTCSCHVPKRFY